MTSQTDKKSPSSSRNLFFDYTCWTEYWRGKAWKLLKDLMKQQLKNRIREKVAAEIPEIPEN